MPIVLKKKMSEYAIVYGFQCNIHHDFTVNFEKVDFKTNFWTGLTIWANSV